MFGGIESDPWFFVSVFTTCLIVGVIIFLLLRAIVLWYWRINEIADSLHWTATHLADINKNLERIGMSDEERKNQKQKELNDAMEKMRDEEGG
jgi:predicted Holliday junction resolvase-like endonuclease